MARLSIHLSTPCRPESARGQVLTRPISGLMRDCEEDTVTGPGWYESSLDLQRGLLVRESAADDRLLHEWQEARRRLAIALPRPRAAVNGEPPNEPAFDPPLSVTPARPSGVRYPGGLDFVV